MARDQALVSRLPVEARLLLMVSGASDGDGEIAALLASHDVDWTALLSLSERERATGVLWRRLRGQSLPTLTDERRSTFEQLSMIADFTAGCLKQRIGDTMAALNARGIRGLLLKGAALAPTVYRSFEERPMGDIDLVVEREHAEGAFEAFQSAGWRWNKSDFPRERYRAHHHFPPLLDDRGMDMRLELHTELFVEGSPFALNAARLFAEGREIEVGKGRAVVPSAEHLLLHACIHFTWSHMMLFGAWRAFRDVIALSRAGIDWDRFVSDAERYRAASSCYWTLRLAERLAGATLPVEVLDRLRRSTSASWAGVCERHAVREMFPSDDRCPSQWLRRRLWELAIRPEAAGHGAVRPWLLDDMAPENVNPAQVEGGMRRAARQVPRIGAWVRYAWGLIG